MNESHTPPWGSSPIQHGHGALQEQASRIEPWTRYFGLAAIGGPPSVDRGRSGLGDEAERALDRVAVHERPLHPVLGNVDLVVLRLGHVGGRARNRREDRVA